MAQAHNPDKRPDDVGSRSPGSEEAREQGMSGNQGPQAGQMEGTGRQPPQGSDRAPAARHQQPAEERKHFAPGHAPSEQGEKDHPSPDVIAQHQQGLGRQSGSHAGSVGDRSQEEATSGEPRAGHTRDGRTETPGDRAQNQ